jgi:hypothetical protein
MSSQSRDHYQPMIIRVMGAIGVGLPLQMTAAWIFDSHSENMSLTQICGAATHRDGLHVCSGVVVICRVRLILDESMRRMQRGMSGA